MLRLAHFAAIGVLLMGMPVQAAEHATEQVAINKPNDPNEILCKAVPPKIGTRLGGGRYCQTRRTWEDQRAQDRDLVEDAQMRDMHGPTGWW